MIHHIPNVLSKEQVAYFRAEMAKVEWIDGQKTTGSLAKNVKNNQQLDVEHPLSQHLGDIILHAVSSHIYDLDLESAHNVIRKNLNLLY